MAKAPDNNEIVTEFGAVPNEINTVNAMIKDKIKNEAHLKLNIANELDKVTSETGESIEEFKKAAYKILLDAQTSALKSLHDVTEQAKESIEKATEDARKVIEEICSK